MAQLRLLIPRCARNDRQIWNDRQVGMVGKWGGWCYEVWPGNAGWIPAFAGMTGWGDGPPPSRGIRVGARGIRVGAGGDGGRRGDSVGGGGIRWAAGVTVGSAGDEGRRGDSVGGGGIRWAAGVMVGGGGDEGRRG